MSPLKSLPALRHILALLVGLIFTFIVLESGFRIAHTWRHMGAGSPEKGNGDPTLMIRIVAVGESTTAPWFVGGRDISWPVLLESRVNQFLIDSRKPYRAKVINIGKHSTSSAFLVRQLENEMDQLNPDIVISMMGINDNHAIGFEQDFFYNHSFVVRFVRWAAIAAACPACQEVTFEPMLENEARWSKADRSIIQRMHKSGLLRPRRQLTYSELQHILSGLEKLRAESGDSIGELNIAIAGGFYSIAQHLDPVGADSKRNSLDPFLTKTQVLEESNRFMSLALPIVEKGGRAMQQYCVIQGQLGRSCADFLLASIEKGLSPSSYLVALAMAGDGAKNQKLMAVLEASGLSNLAGGRPYESTYLSYQKLGELCAKHDLVWVAMQYPTGTIAGIKGLLLPEAISKYHHFSDAFFAATLAIPIRPEFGKVFFVSNENFNQTVTPENSDQYFVDHFARSSGLNFGHTTEKGNSLIVDNVVSEMKRNWDSIEDRIQRRRPSLQTK